AEPTGAGAAADLHRPARAADASVLPVACARRLPGASGEGSPRRPAVWEEEAEAVPSPHSIHRWRPKRTRQQKPATASGCTTRECGNLRPNKSERSPHSELLASTRARLRGGNVPPVGHRSPAISNFR